MIGINANGRKERVYQSSPNVADNLAIQISEPIKSLKRKFTFEKPFTPDIISELPLDLKILDVHPFSWQLSSEEEVARFAKRIKHLQTLDIQGTIKELLSKDLAIILMANQQITKLLAGNSQIDGPCLNALPQNALETLSLRYSCDKLKVQEVIEFLEKNRQLSTLRLNADLAIEEVAEAIARYCPQLKVLELVLGENISEECFLKIATIVPVK